MSEGNVGSKVSELNEEEEIKRLQKNVEITLGDIQVICNIIDIGTQRGAFRASELKGVGEYYERMTKILSSQK